MVDPTAVYTVVRVWTALLGTAVVALLFLVARRVFGERAALAGAALTAVAPFQHEWSRVARTDIPTTLFALAATWCALRLLEDGRARWYLGAAAAAALASASKYPGGIALLAPALAHLFRWRAGRGPLLAPKVLLLPLGFLVAFLASSPYILLDRAGVVRDIGGEWESGHLGADRMPGVWNALWYLYAALPTALGWPTWLVALPSGLLSLRRQTTARLVFAAFPVAYLVVMIEGPLRWATWTIPCLPFIAAWAGWGIDRAASRLAASRPRAALARPAFALGVAIVALWPTGVVIARDYRSLLIDTRTEATYWYPHGIPKGAKVAFEFYAGQPPPGIRLHRRGLLGNKPLDEYRAEGYEYLVFSDWMYGRVYAEPKRFPREVAIYEDMWRRGELVREFDPRVLNGWLGRRGPTIRVLRISP